MAGPGALTRIDSTPNMATTTAAASTTPQKTGGFGGAMADAAVMGGAALSAAGGLGAVATGVATGADMTSDGSIAIMAAANAEQNKMAAASAMFQTMGALRSMMMQALRDLIKDAKDTVKDQGEAGHKP